MISKSIAVVFIAASSTAAVLSAVRNNLNRSCIVFASAAMLVVCDLLVGSGLNARLMNDMTMASSALLVMTSSVWRSQFIDKYVDILMGVMFLTMIYDLLSLFFHIPILGIGFFLNSSILTVLLTSILFIVWLSVRISNVKEVLKAGAVWPSLSLSVEVVYILTLFIYVTLFSLTCSMGKKTETELQVVMLVLSFGLYAAIGVRLFAGSLFVFRHKHEDIIIESMKVTQVEVAGDNSRIDAHTKELFDRVQDYFEEAKPYLKGDLTINDVVKVMYTNKVYISRAISHATGRNFCQYVNYHRIMHSVKLFRNNPRLKIHELATKSGFNTVVSFNMAFRLYMGENPSDWCRKEKNRLTVRKNNLCNR